MQKLLYHPAWKKQVDPTLEQKIQKSFSKTKDDKKVSVVPLQQAINHHGDYLLTVILHNREEKPIKLSELHLFVSMDNFQATQNQFPTADWAIEPKTSSPWTFIFHQSNVSGELTANASDLDIEII